MKTFQPDPQYRKRPLPAIARSFTLLSLAGLVASCTTVGPDFSPPDVDVPATWRETADPTAADAAHSPASWWTNLKDPILDEWMERVLDEGLALREAMARLREARAIRGATETERLPTIEAGASYQRVGESRRIAPETGGNSDLYVGRLDAAWEIDLWGRIRRSIEAADAQWEAAIEDVRAIRLALAAETAATYVEMRAFQRRAALARTHVTLQEQTLDLVRARFDAGLVSERDIAQATMNLERTRALVPSYEAGLRSAENRLAILAGIPPAAHKEGFGEGVVIPVPPADAVVPMPADVLRRRPDVRRAERILVAEYARIGVATADLYPRLALFGTLGVATSDAGDLFRGGSDFFSIGPSVRWNLFDGGRARRMVEAQEARAEQARVRWEGAVLVAFEETENALSNFHRERHRRDSLLVAAASARRVVELAQIEYVEGASDFQIVLDSERELAQIEDELVQAETSITAQYIALQKAVGG